MSIGVHLLSLSYMIGLENINFYLYFIVISTNLDPPLCGFCLFETNLFVHLLIHTREKAVKIIHIGIDNIDTY